MKTKKQDPTAEQKDALDDDLDRLFKLPVAEFTAARNTLVAQLKKGGRGSDADLVKALAKPSITAWAVNQLYWTHREEFDRLIATGERFREAQTSRLAQKVADMRSALDARREELLRLSDLATALLRNAGNNPTPDTIHRITTTLEAMSAYESLPDGQRPGRLSHDVDPPGFGSLGSFVPAAGASELKKETAQAVSPRKAGRADTSTERKTQAADDARQIEEKRKADIAAAKTLQRNARSLLDEAQAKAQRLEAAQKKINAEVKEYEKQRREAQKLFEKAKAASEYAALRARTITAELEEAAKSADDAKRAFEKASKELESSLR